MKKPQKQKLNYSYPIYVLMSVYLFAFVYKIAFDRTFDPYTDSSIIGLHLSNFAITGLIVSLEMLKDVRKGKYSATRLRSLVLISIALNIVVESISIKDIQLPFGVTWANFNTADPLDAVFGIVAALLFFGVIRLSTISETK